MRDKETIRARPSLASIALKDRMMRIRNILIWVVGPKVVVIIKTNRSARVSRARRAGKRRVRWRRKVKRAARIISGWRVVKVSARRGITIGEGPVGGLQDRCFNFSFNGMSGDRYADFRLPKPGFYIKLSSERGIELYF